MSNSEQNLKNHGRLDPFFHFFTFALYLINLIYAGFYAYHQRTTPATWYFVVSLAVVVPISKIRSYSLKVQDRVIRLEERLRLQSLAPVEWHRQIYQLTEDQLIGLRFAGDDEVVALAKEALEKKLDRKQIKERIKDWRPDNWRI